MSTVPCGFTIPRPPPKSHIRLFACVGVSSRMNTSWHSGTRAPTGRVMDTAASIMSPGMKGPVLFAVYPTGAGSDDDGSSSIIDWTLLWLTAKLYVPAGLELSTQTWTVCEFAPTTPTKLGSETGGPTTFEVTVPSEHAPRTASPARLPAASATRAALTFGYDNHAKTLDRARIL